MYARIVQVPMTPGTGPDATTYFRQTLGPVLMEQPGFVNSHFLVDETRTQAETSGVLKTALADMKPYLAGPPTVTYYEVAVQVN